jgi:signal transduction histidine kinase
MERRGNWVLRISQLAAVGFMGLLLLLDIDLDLINRADLLSTWNVAHCAIVLATVAVWLPTHRHGSRMVPAAAFLLGVFSLLLTMLWTIRPLPADGPDRWGPSSWGLSEAFGMLLVLLVVTRRGAAKIAIVALAVDGLALLAQPLRSSSSSEALSYGLIQALGAAAVVATGTYLRYLDGIRARQVVATRLEQRAEFARDLHDFIAHHVTGIVVQAQGARLIADRDPQRAATALEQIERAGLEAMSAMRRMVGVLRDQGTQAPLAPLRDIGDLEGLIEGFTAAGGPPVRLQSEGQLADVPVDLATTAHRVVMEALTNVRQHATGATIVDVSIRRTADWLFVTVTDDGQPQYRTGLTRDRTGFGLVGLTERVGAVGAVGGRLRTGPGIDRGWIVDAALPISERGAR